MMFCQQVSQMFLGKASGATNETFIKTPLFNTARSGLWFSFYGPCICLSSAYKVFYHWVDALRANNRTFKRDNDPAVVTMNGNRWRLRQLWHCCFYRLFETSLRFIVFSWHLDYSFQGSWFFSILLGIIFSTGFIQPARITFFSGLSALHRISAPWVSWSVKAIESVHEQKDSRDTSGLLPSTINCPQIISRNENPVTLFIGILSMHDARVQKMPVELDQ